VPKQKIKLSLHYLFRREHVLRMCGMGSILVFSGILLADGNALTQHSGIISLQIGNQDKKAITLETRQAPLGQILKEITNKTGAIIHYSVLPEAPVTATCVGATVRHIMDCLVGSQVGMVAHSPQPGKAAEFWLLGSSVGSCQTVTIELGEQPVSVVQSNEPQSVPEAPKLTRQQRSDALLEQLKKGQTATQRNGALIDLATFGQLGDPNLRKALEDASVDSDASVRASAISTLTNLSKEKGSDVADILHRALHDSDASVRMIALDNAADDTEIYKQALNDSDNGLREFAAAKLEQIRKNAEKREDREGF